MTHHARQLEATPRNRVVLGIPAVMEVGVGADCLAGHFVESNILSREFGSGSNDDDIGDPFRVGQAPLQRLHAAEAATDHRSETLDSQTIRQACLAVHPVTDRHHGKFRAPLAPGSRVVAGWSGTAVAAAQVVQ